MANHKEYIPFRAECIGNTVSCHTLERMLNEIRSPTLNRKVAAHISRYFKKVKEVANNIDCPDTRAYVGKLILKDVKSSPPEIICPERIWLVIKNVKYAYIKDLFINEEPLNYRRRDVCYESSDLQDYIDSFYSFDAD